MIKVITDSSCDLPAEFLKRYQIEMVPLKVSFEDGSCFLDRVEITPQDFWQKMQGSSVLPKTSAPDPNTFLQAFKNAIQETGGGIYIALSSGLSSTHQTALLARDMLEREKRASIKILDSLSGSLGVGVLAIRTSELVEKGLELDAVMERLTKYRDDLNTIFTLDTLENIIKGGRLTRFQGLVGSLLDIKPILMGAQGKVEVLEKLRGRRKALNRLTKMIGEMADNVSERIIGISHVDCLPDVNYLIQEIEKRYGPVRIVVSEMGSTMGTYAGKGGIIMSF